MAAEDSKAALPGQLASQVREALDPVNRWYCSQYFGYKVEDPEILLAYYIKHGGAEHYRQVVDASSVAK